MSKYSDGYFDSASLRKLLIQFLPGNSLTRLNLQFLHITHSRFCTSFVPVFVPVIFVPVLGNPN